MRILLVLALLMSFAGEAEAYSYAAAGKEPLIDAREAILQAVNGNDWKAAETEFAKIRKDVEYLDGNHDAGLLKEFEAALGARASEPVFRALGRTFVSEIIRRLEAGKANIDNYQVAKVLVVKSKHFLDSMGAELDPGARKAAEDGMKACLGAIGNPGVFGVGKKAPDPEAYEDGLAKVIGAFGR